MAEQKVDFNKQIYNYSVTTGKDCKLFICIALEENGEKKYYNVPLTEIVALQAFTSTAKETRYAFGNADPVGLTVGNTKVAGQLTAVVRNESLAEQVKKQIKNYKPVAGSDLNLSVSGAVTLDDLERLKHLDQLPEFSIKLYVKSLTNKKVFSRTIYGCVFISEGSTIGGSAVMQEQYSFAASSIGSMRIEEVSSDVDFGGIGR